MGSFPKPETYRSERYLGYVRSQPCLVHGCKIEAEAHHAGGIVSGRGVGSKGSDYRAVPLCRVHHTYYHTCGKTSFAQKFSVDVEEAIIKILEAYISLLESGLDHRRRKLP
jgi:hypothetical protein